jgi:N-acyl-D-aspartate/D-glutamate deacylase
MAYDLLIKNGRVVDGSGMPAFRGDIGVHGGRITELGKLSGSAKRTLDAEGRVVSPGFVDNHCHFDAQVTWDPLCSFSPQHGATTVVFGNCSLALAPIRPGAGKRVAEFLSYVEAIPMEVLSTVPIEWETIPQYMNRLEGRLGVNVGNLIGHSTVSLLRHGRREPGAHCDPRRNRSDEGGCARRHEGRCARPLGVA